MIFGLCCKRVHFSDYKCSGDGGEKGSEEEELEKQCDKKLLPNEARHPDSTLVCLPDKKEQLEKMSFFEPYLSPSNLSA